METNEQQNPIKMCWNGTAASECHFRQVGYKHRWIGPSMTSSTDDDESTRVLPLTIHWQPQDVKLAINYLPFWFSSSERAHDRTSKCSVKLSALRSLRCRRSHWNGSIFILSFFLLLLFFLFAASSPISDEINGTCMNCQGVGHRPNRARVDHKNKLINSNMFYCLRWLCVMCVRAANSTVRMALHMCVARISVDTWCASLISFTFPLHTNEWCSKQYFAEMNTLPDQIHTRAHVMEDNVQGDRITVAGSLHRCHNIRLVMVRDFFQNIVANSPSKTRND